MNLEDYITAREARDPEFAAAREALRPQYEFRRALIKARLERGLTQRAMAEKLGVKQSALARWEAGETLPTLTTLYRLAQVLDLEFAITPERPLVVVSH